MIELVYPKAPEEPTPPESWQGDQPYAEYLVRLRNGGWVLRGRLDPWGDGIFQILQVDIRKTPGMVRLKALSFFGSRGVANLQLANLYRMHPTTVSLRDEEGKVRPLVDVFEQERGICFEEVMQHPAIRRRIEWFGEHGIEPYRAMRHSSMKALLNDVSSYQSIKIREKGAA